MWQPPTPISFNGRVLSGLDAWIYVFATTWAELEDDPDELFMTGFNSFGPAVAELHGDEDAAVVARRIYPKAGEFTDALYPAFAIPPSPPFEPIEDGDVPF